jgi:hypothetical protein
MAITETKLREVEQEMARLTIRIIELREATNSCEYPWSPKETGAVRRASLDLTRALAKLRSASLE